VFSARYGQNMYRAYSFLSLKDKLCSLHSSPRVSDVTAWTCVWWNGASGWMVSKSRDASERGPDRPVRRLRSHSHVSLCMCDVIRPHSLYGVPKILQKSFHLSS
jgi:hypothetical protein